MHSNNKQFKITERKSIFCSKDLSVCQTYESFSCKPSFIFLNSFKCKDKWNEAKPQKSCNIHLIHMAVNSGFKYVLSQITVGIPQNKRLHPPLKAVR